MKFELREITIREIVHNYVDNEEEGLIGYNGKLNIRPAYQREFVYNDVRRNAVVYSILRGFPLNVLYWLVNSNGTYEILDGQQRTICFCQYVNNDYSIVFRGQPAFFRDLPEAEQNRILNYRLMVYLCEGDDKGKINWFRIINIAGEKMTDQELRNAIYAGEWLVRAKKLFSKNECPAYQSAKDYVDGSLIRQDFLEKAISWVSGGEIEKYMAVHQHDNNADELWEHFEKVIAWVKSTFITPRPEMKGLDWGMLYDEYKDEIYDTDKLDAEIQELMDDDDVTDKSSIFHYVLSSDADKGIGA
jgi:hypothetical protein